MFTHDRRSDGLPRSRETGLAVARGFRIAVPPCVPHIKCPQIYMTFSWVGDTGDAAAAMGGREAGAPGPDPHAAADRIPPDHKSPPAPPSPRPRTLIRSIGRSVICDVDRRPESRCWCFVNLFDIFVFDEQRKFHIGSWTIFREFLKTQLSLIFPIGLFFY